MALKPSWEYTVPIEMTRGVTNWGTHEPSALIPHMTLVTHSRRQQITLEPNVLRWARERVNLSPETLAEKMKVKPDRVTEWEQSGKISIAQAERLAARTHTPLGYLYLGEPPDDSLPIRDFRTQGGDLPNRPSPNLLDTIYLMQRRQAWLRDDLIENEEDPLPFIGAYSRVDGHTKVAAAMRDALGLKADWAGEQKSWREALSFLRNRMDQFGILVVFNGVVGNSNNRKLDPKEFLGFALMDEFAPLVFVNSRYYIAAQIFTLAHEVAHLFIGETGVSAMDRLLPAGNAIEQFCNRTAAEFLVPAVELRAYWPTVQNQNNAYQKVARKFKVSAIVAARRLHDLDLIERDTFFDFYEEKKGQGKSPATISSGGNFWNTQKWRISPRFAIAVVRAAREGRLLNREAYSLTGLKRNTFERMPQEMGIQL